MNKDTVEGGFKKEAAKVRTAVDEAVGDKKGANQGRVDQATGAIQETYGKAKDAIKKASNS